MNQLFKNIDWLQVVTFSFILKCLVGMGTPLDGFVLLLLTGLNVFLYFHNNIQANKFATEEIEKKLNARIEKLENVTSQLSMTQGFKRS